MRVTSTNHPAPSATTQNRTGQANTTAGHSDSSQHVTKPNATSDSFETHQAFLTPLSGPGQTPRQGLLRSVMCNLGAASPNTSVNSSPRQVVRPQAPTETTQTPQQAERKEGVSETKTTCNQSLDHSIEARQINEDLRSGRLTPDQAVTRADEYAQSIRENCGSPRDVEAFYRELAQQTKGIPGTISPSGGECYQNENITGTTGSSGFESTVFNAFDRRADRAGFEADMTDSLGRTVDPNNLSDVRDYMDHVAQHEGIQGVQREVHEYLDNFYVHGGSVDYSRWPQAPNVDDIQNSALQNGDGRRIIDCDGFAAVANEITNGLQDGRYQTQWSYAQRDGGSHAMLGIEDTQTGQGFVVDNQLTDATYNFQPGTDSETAFRQGVDSTLRRYHANYPVGGSSVGAGRTLQDALEDIQPR